VSAAAPPSSAPWTQAAPPAEPNLQAELAQQDQEGNQVESEAGVEAKNLVPGTAATAPAAAPAQISLGQSVAEVEANVGKPKTQAVVGTKQILIFPDGMKVTFEGGKVSDIQ
jgi:hypothetical protein